MGLGPGNPGDLFEVLLMLLDQSADPAFLVGDLLLAPALLDLGLAQTALLAFEHVDLTVQLLLALVQAGLQLAQRALVPLQFPFE